jgi:hypothetical protein
VEALLLSVHSIVRYLVFVTVLVVLAASLVGVGKGRVTPATTVAFRVFVAAFDVQAAIGIVLLILRGFYGQLMGHLILMIGALAWAHFVLVFVRKRPEDPKLAGLVVVTILGCLALMAAAIMAIGRPIV